MSQLAGNTPVVKDRLASFAKSGVITSAASFSSEVGMQSSGEDLDGASLISRTTYSVLTACKVSIAT